MKLLELEISNVRGIVHQILKPEGENLVIWGPNGSGKSAVVDSIDFLLTGKITRLTGEGTGSITMTKHGVHIGHKIEEARVRAIVQLSNQAEPVEIGRSMAEPSILECREDHKLVLEPIVALASRGQYILTRREILKFITAVPRTRAQAVQELLNVQEIESIRQSLVKAYNDLEKKWETLRNVLERAKGAVNATTQQPSFDASAVLNLINQNRAVLGGRPISRLSSADLKRDLKPPPLAGLLQEINVEMLKRDTDNLCEALTERTQRETARMDNELRSAIEALKSNHKAMREVSRLQLTRLGIQLIGETGACPLCDTAWTAGELKRYLQGRISAATVALTQQKEILGISGRISERLNKLISSLEKVTTAARSLNLRDDANILDSWLRDLRDLSDSLSSPMEKYPDERFPTDKVKTAVSPSNLKSILTGIDRLARDRYPVISKQQTAWDTLTRLEENLKSYEAAANECGEAKASAVKAAILLDCFLRSRDAVLGKIYHEIQGRFVDLYRQLHGDDEKNFAANICPTETGLDLKVDFYGRGSFPPRALHSEGHQDSMGVCLYLALAEYLNKDIITLVVLDDVVMSVDSEHRRSLCDMLARSFPDRQFLITTHDRTWANQLKSGGVVKSRNLVEFYNWHIDTGPFVDLETDIWKRIEEDLRKDDVAAAAARLRRGAEHFFGEVCNGLQAPVVYKLDARWELGDLLPAAMGQYNKLLKKAKDSANSWNDENRMATLTEIEGIASQIYSRTQAEQWAVNANVHYSNWGSSTPADFRPVCEAFQDLFQLFICGKCGSLIQLACVANAPVAVCCSCGKIDWNLRERS